MTDTKVEHEHDAAPVAGHKETTAAAEVQVPVHADEVATADAQAVVRGSYSRPVVRPVRVELEHRSKLDRACLHNEHLGSPFLRVDRLDDDMSL